MEQSSDGQEGFSDTDAAVLGHLPDDVDAETRAMLEELRKKTFPYRVSNG